MLTARKDLTRDGNTFGKLRASSSDSAHLGMHAADDTLVRFRYLVIHDVEFARNQGGNSDSCENFDYTALFPAITCVFYASPYFPPLLFTKQAKMSEIPRSYALIITKSIQARSLGHVFFYAGR